MNDKIKYFLIIMIISVITYIKMFNYDKLYPVYYFFINIFLFIKGLETFNSDGLKKIFRYLFLLIFYNALFNILKNGILVNDKFVLNIVKETFLLKNIEFELFLALFISSFVIIVCDKKKILVLLSIILSLSIFYYKNHVLLYPLFFIIGILLKNKINIKNTSSKFNYFISKSFFSTYVVNIFITFILLNSEIIKYDNISDYIGVIILSVILGLITGVYYKMFPILSKLF